MKKRQITYGVSGMMEYQAVVKVGNKNVSINFSDGSMSAMGTNPATFTTDNIIIQNAIEASNDYKRGRITIVRSITLDEELQVIRNIPRPAPDIAAEEPETEEEIIPDNTEEEAEKSAEPNSEINTCHTEVEFSCNDDAKDYLEQNFGYVRSKLRNREDMISAGMAHGVKIIFV